MGKQGAILRALVVQIKVRLGLLRCFRLDFRGIIVA